MTTVIAIENEVQIPADLRDLSDFRRWTHSRSFPERGRIDYVDGRIEVDMSPEDLFLHATPKTTIVYAIKSVVLQDDRGHVCVDSMRLVSERGDLSVEPDVVFVSFESLDSGKVELVGASRPEATFIEFRGAADLVVEVVSRSSTNKDLKLLPKAYFRAGVREYWIADVRRSSRFTIYKRGKRAFEATPVDPTGFQPSCVLERRFRFRRERHRRGHWEYYMDVEPIARQ
jgi:Uma2 family endonuclease